MLCLDHGSCISGSLSLLQPWKTSNYEANVRNCFLRLSHFKRLLSRRLPLGRITSALCRKTVIVSTTCRTAARHIWFAKSWQTISLFKWLWFESWLASHALSKHLRFFRTISGSLSRKAFKSISLATFLHCLFHGADNVRPFPASFPVN